MDANIASNDTVRGDILSTVIPAFGNLGHALQTILLNFSELMALSGIKTKEEWTIEPLSVMLIMEFAMLFAMSATANLLSKPLVQVKSVRGSEESSSKVTGLEGKPLRKVLLKILVLLPFSLFVVILPVSFFFSLFYFTRGYTTEHTEFDMTTVSFVTDAICCGLLFFFQSVLLGCLFSAFRGYKPNGKVWKWKMLNINGHLVGAPRFILVPAAMLYIVVYALSPSPANDLMFFPLFLLSYLWSSVQNVWSVQQVKPFKIAFLNSILYAIATFFYLYLFSFSEVHFNFKKWRKIEDVEFGLNQRLWPWSIYIWGLSASVGMIGFHSWCIRFDYELERARKHVTRSVIELVDQPVSVDGEGSHISFSRGNAMMAFVDDLADGVIRPGIYSRVAVALWAVVNVALYLTLHSYHIYLGGPFYTFISSILSQIVVSAGTFILALIRGELSSLWEYEAKAILEVPSKKPTMKWSVEDLFGVDMDSGDNIKEGKEILVDV